MGNLEKSARADDLATPAAGGTIDRARTGICAFAVALAAGVELAEFYLFFHTEGRFFRASESQNLVDAITYSGKGITVPEDKELWDMPIVLLLLLGFMGSEWMYRRSRGLA